METLDNIGIKLFVLPALKVQVVRIFGHSFVCLGCVMPISIIDCVW